MSLLSRAFEALFSTSEEIQLKHTFDQAAQALSANDIPALKAALANKKFERPAQQALLLNAITADNVDGLVTILKATDTTVSELLTVRKHNHLVFETLDTPMLPFAIGRGSEKIAGYLASHPDTNLQAACRAAFIVCGSPSAGFYSECAPIVVDVRSAAHDAGMTGVEEIINARLQGAVKPPSNG